MKNKLERYLQNKQNNYIIEEGKFIYNKLKGNWNKIFKNNNPIFLELACGNGEYTINNSIKFQNNNYIGIDIKGSRLWKGGQKLKEIKSKNAFFLRIQIENILNFFNNNEVSEILITFPDPRPKKRDIKKRLTSQNFISKYYEILKNNGKLKLKTDDIILFEFSNQIINRSKFTSLKKTNNLYKCKNFKSIKEIKTKYENIFLEEGKNIKYLECKKLILN